ncbi:MAG: glycosyltransferase [Desulfovibrio sp.]|jgi:glycosyltransferase involved in cell wall biosynthesis|nr:glycosyltransferase [Desulfovibrio sp.]
MKYSIITATYNSEAFLGRTLASILSQSYPNFEWVVQDGGSTDNTLNILRKYSDSRIKIHSEPDTGIYDAWNKAVARATGDWAIFLGGDDFFLHQDVLVKCHRHIRRLDKRILFAYGALIWLRGDNVERRQSYTLQELYTRFSYGVGFPFAATFIRLRLLRRYPFDAEHYKIAGDYDFVARFVTHDNVARIPVMAVGMEKGGVSSTPKYHCLMLNEVCRVMHERVLPRSSEFMLGCFENYWEQDDHLE